MKESKLKEVSMEITKRLKESKLDKYGDIDTLHITEPMYELKDWFQEYLWDINGVNNPYTEEERMLLCDKKVYLFLRTFDREVLDTVIQEYKDWTSTLLTSLDGSFGVFVGHNFNFTTEDVFDHPEQFDGYIKERVEVKCPELVLQ